MHDPLNRVLLSQILEDVREIILLVLICCDLFGPFLFTLQGGKPGILLFSFPGLENTWNLFQVSLFKMSFTKIILIYIFVISTLSTQTL